MATDTPELPDRQEFSQDELEEAIASARFSGNSFRMTGRTVILDQPPVTFYSGTVLKNNRLVIR